MKFSVFALLCLFLCSCSSVTHTLKYGFLPGSDFEYYAPTSKIDLKGKKYNIEVIDNRFGNTITCYNHSIPRDSELENEVGFEYFKNYVKAMIEFNNGVVDPSSDETIKIQLNAISGELRGFGYARVFGLVEFEATISSGLRTYCSTMADGDEGAPLGKFSIDTRKGAFRKLVSASTRVALEQFIHDLAAPNS